MKTTTLVATFAAFALVSAGCKGGGEAAVQMDTTQLALYGPLPEVMEAAANQITEAKIELGRKLYFETRLSASDDISCNSCHDLPHYGADTGAVSVGHQGQKGSRNSPTVYNAAGHIAQFWDGRAAVTHQPSDRFFFKVPSLRNIEHTAPYFHNGAVRSLDTAVVMMAHHQLGRTLTPEQVASIVTWLRSLTGEIPTAYIAPHPRLSPITSSARTTT